MRRVVSRSLLVLGFAVTTLIASAAYADDGQQAPSLWEQVIVWVANRIGLPPG